MLKASWDSAGGPRVRHSEGACLWRVVAGERWRESLWSELSPALYPEMGES